MSQHSPSTLVTSDAFKWNTGLIQLEIFSIPFSNVHIPSIRCSGQSLENLFV